MMLIIIRPCFTGNWQAEKHGPIDVFYRCLVKKPCFSWTISRWSTALEEERKWIFRSPCANRHFRWLSMTSEENQKARSSRIFVKYLTNILLERAWFWTQNRKNVENAQLYCCTLKMDVEHPFRRLWSCHVNKQYARVQNARVWSALYHSRPKIKKTSSKNGYLGIFAMTNKQTNKKILFEKTQQRTYICSNHQRNKE